MVPCTRRPPKSQSNSVPREGGLRSKRHMPRWGYTSLSMLETIKPHPTKNGVSQRVRRSALRAAAVSALVLFSWARGGEAQADDRAAEPWLEIETQGDACIAAGTLGQEIERLLNDGRPAGVRESDSGVSSESGWGESRGSTDMSSARKQWHPCAAPRCTKGALPMTQFTPKTGDQ